MKWFGHNEQPADGEARALPAPQPLQGYWESAATHEVWSEAAGGWVPAVVEEIAGRAFVTPCMKTWPEDGE